MDADLDLQRTVEVDLAGRTALVTGAASGIGRACARRLAVAGAKALVVDRDADGVRRVADEVGGSARVVDLTDLDAVDELDGALDVVVNNAGFQHVAPLREFPPERFSQMLRVASFVTGASIVMDGGWSAH
jgi:3-hydroxybutyrate dehydrogenase